MTLVHRLKEIVKPWVPALLRALLRAYRSRSTPKPSLLEGAPDWRRWLRQDAALWSQAKAKAALGPPVLIATSVGGFKPGAHFESLLAAALALRGANVKILLCDKVLPACLQAHITQVPDPQVLARYELNPVLCRQCHRHGSALFAPLGLDTIRYSSLLTPRDLRECRQTAHEIPRDDIRS